MIEAVVFDLDVTDLSTPKSWAGERTLNTPSGRLGSYSMSRKNVEDTGGTVAGVHLREERLAEEIVALAEELGIGLMVVGSRGRGGEGGFSPAASPIGSSITRAVRSSW